MGVGVKPLSSDGDETEDSGETAESGEKSMSGDKAGVTWLLPGQRGKLTRKELVIYFLLSGDTMPARRSDASQGTGLGYCKLLDLSSKRLFDQGVGLKKHLYFAQHIIWHYVKVCLSK